MNKKKTTSRLKKVKVQTEKKTNYYQISQQTTLLN